MTDKSGAGAGALMGNVVPVLSLLLIGYPLGGATIRTMLIGWFLVIVAITKFILSAYLKRDGSAVTVRTVTRHYR
jgi:uncharacterized membrane protein HdeD (DUF308 family)